MCGRMFTTLVATFGMGLICVYKREFLSDLQEIQAWEVAEIQFLDSKGPQLQLFTSPFSSTFP